MAEPQATVTHQYTFTFYDVPTIAALTAALDNAATIMGPDARVRFGATNNQRDGHTLTATVTAPTARP